MRISRKMMGLVGGLGLLAASTGLADLLGVLPEFPVVSFNSTGVTSFDATNEHFSVSATPLAIRFSPSEPPRLVGAIDGVRVLTIDVFINADGLLVGGHPAEDLLVIGSIDANGDGTPDYSGVLLTGEIVAFGSSNTGGTTDLFDFRFTFTGGELAPFFAGYDIGLLLTIENSTFDGRFDSNFGGGAKGILGPIPQLITQHSGCTPGYWRQPHHFHNWPAPYSPNMLFKDVFGRNVPGNPTLVLAVRLGGGHLNALMRHSVAALLNAASPLVDPDPAFATPSQVINAFQQAFDSRDYEPTKNLFEASNELGCPL